MAKVIPVFKPGDKIRRIGKDANKELFKGKIFTVKEYTCATNIYLEEIKQGFMPEYFELVIFNEPLFYGEENV